MARSAFIGLGNMGGPMARNLVKAGHQRRRLRPVARGGRALRRGGRGGRSARPQQAAHGADIVITMLPAGKHVREVYLGARGRARRGAAGHAADRLLDHRRRRPRARSARRRREQGLPMIDAPVSGGVGGAEAGTLTFMVGGSRRRLRAGQADPRDDGQDHRPRRRRRAAGQAAKICNNMILGISMIAVGEAFVLAEKLGLDAQKLFDISSQVVGPVLVADQLLPGAGTGADLAGQPRLRRRASRPT